VSVSRRYHYDRVNDLRSVKISLARPQDIRSWSFGEVKKPETINYRTYRPEKDGLFCERIFGPEKDWECACGKYRGMKYKGMICDRCGVKVTHSPRAPQAHGAHRVGRSVVHIWFFKSMPSRLGRSAEHEDHEPGKGDLLPRLRGYRSPGTTELQVQQLLTEESIAKRAPSTAKVRSKRTWAQKQFAKAADQVSIWSKLSGKLRKELSETNSKQKKKDLINRLKIGRIDSRQRQQAEWMVLDVIPSDSTGPCVRSVAR
jgi:DNA-directed RNA polymerase subunit beta'